VPKPEPVKEVNGWKVSVAVSDMLNFYATKFLYVKGAYSSNTWLFRYPTMNCQLTTICSMENFLNFVKDDNDVIPILQAFYELGKWQNKITLIDVKKTVWDRVDKIFEKYVFKKLPYDSTNGSAMCLYLLKLPPVTIPPVTLPS
jgi:hypothetical protein